MSHGQVQRDPAGVLAAAINVEGPIDYLLPAVAGDPSNRLPEADPAALLDALDSLGAAMAETGGGGNSQIPAIYTYFGQFIDHDITRIKERGAASGAPDAIEGTFVPLPIETAKARFTNTRRAVFDLDSVYGDGPSFAGEPATEAQGRGMYDGARLRTSTVTTAQALPTLPIPVRREDLLREARSPMAIIGDERNDENLIVGQLHLAFVLFHNEVVDKLSAENPGLSSRQTFDEAARLVRMHYQWLVVNDFLKRVCDAAVVERVIATRAATYTTRHTELGLPLAFVPLEFTVAAYRFGHSMIRESYDWNSNFNVAKGNARFDEFFRFTGGGGMVGLPTFPHNWIADWSQMAEAATAKPGGFARPIDIFLAPPLLSMRNEVGQLMKHLARRNLRRGYLLSLPHGQALAAALALPSMTESEVEAGLSRETRTVFRNADLSKRTPLWFYVLQEARQKAGGERLGPLGSQIVAETIIGLMVVDSTSFLNVAGGWAPAAGLKLPDGREINTLADLLRFARLLSL
jgi:hypothetical protein